MLTLQLCENAESGGRPVQAAIMTSRAQHLCGTLLRDMLAPNDRTVKKKLLILANVSDLVDVTAFLFIFP